MWRGLQEGEDWLNSNQFCPGVPERNRRAQESAPDFRANCPFPPQLTLFLGQLLTWRWRAIVPTGPGGPEPGLKVRPGADDCDA